MPGPTTDGFYDLSANSDNFQLTVGLLAGLPGGLRGLEGNDFIRGSAAPELANGNQGNDTLIGGAGNDVLFGGKDRKGSIHPSRRSTPGTPVGCAIQGITKSQPLLSAREAGFQIC